MKKKVLNQANAIRGSLSSPKGGLYISVTGNAGLIGISKQLGDKLDLLNHGINFIQDEDRPIDWYLQPSKDDNAFKVRSKERDHKSAYHYVIQSKKVCSEIFLSCGLERKTHRFIVSPEPIERWSLCDHHKIGRALQKIPPQANERPKSQK